MSDTSTLGVAVVGLGVGEQHARAFHADSRCKIRFLYDLDLARARFLAKNLGASVVAPDYQTILNSPEVQIVSIASYDDDHAEQILLALQAGKHVFVEKPLCQTTAQLQAIKQAWTAHGGKLKLVSNLVLRAAPLYKWLKQQVEGGEFGDIYAFDGDYLYGRLHKIVSGWRGQIETYSAMQGGGIHLIDLMLWITKDLPRQVYASGNQIATKGTGFHHADFIAATTLSDSGLLSRFTVNLGCVHRHQHVVRMFGTKATFIYDDAGPRLHLTRDPAVSASPIILPTLPATKGDLVPAFVSAVVNDEDISSETQMVFDGISIATACDLALKTQKLEDIIYI